MLIPTSCNNNPPAPAVGEIVVENQTKDELFVDRLTEGRTPCTGTVTERGTGMMNTFSLFVESRCFIIVIR